MSNISKRRREGSRAKIKSMGDHKEFLKRITKTLYYGQLPSLPNLSLPVTEISCSVWSEWHRGRSVRRLHADAAAGLARAVCVSPAALVLALLYVERLRASAPDYLSATNPADLFLVTLMVGNKFLQDDGEEEEVVCAEWAASGGLRLAHLKRLELDFLGAIEWNVYVNEESFEQKLQWLERRVALRQAEVRGFFTYGDLAAGCDGALLRAELRALAAGGAAAAAACLAALLAALASALLAPTLFRLLTLRHLAALSSLSRSPTSPANAAIHPPPAPHSFPAPLTLTQYVPNSTVDLQTEELAQHLQNSMDSVRAACCTRWQRHREEQLVETQREWSDSVILSEPKSLEPLWSRTSLLNWLYQSSLVNPVQRWLEKINQYADLYKRELHTPRTYERCPEYKANGFNKQQRCLHQWLNLSKLNALVGTVSDR